MRILRSSRLIWFVLVVVEALGAPGLAQTVPPTCTPEDSTRCAVPLEKGSAAPYSGQLLSPNLAIDLGQKAEFCTARMNLELEHTKKLAEINLSLEKQQHALDLTAWAEQKKLLLGRLEESQKGPSWFERPLFVIIVTAAATTALCYGMFSAAKAQ